MLLKLFSLAIDRFDLRPNVGSLKRKGEKTFKIVELKESNLSFRAKAFYWLFITVVVCVCCCCDARIVLRHTTKFLINDSKHSRSSSDWLQQLSVAREQIHAIPMGAIHIPLKVACQKREREAKNIIINKQIFFQITTTTSTSTCNLAIKRMTD